MKRNTKKNKSLFFVIITLSQEGQQIIVYPVVDRKFKRELLQIAFETPNRINHFFVLAGSIKEAKEICNKRLDNHSLSVYL